MSDPKSHSTAITVAIIGAIGLVLAALITGYLQRPPVQVPEHQATEPTSVPAVEGRKAASPLQLVSAHVGLAGSSGPVRTPTTSFGPKDPIALTLRINASPSVANFPVRVDASLSGFIGSYRASKSADVSKPGIQELTFRFPANGEPIEPLVMSVEFDGERVFGKEVSIDQ